MFSRSGPGVRPCPAVLSSYSRASRLQSYRRRASGYWSRVPGLGLRVSYLPYGLGYPCSPLADPSFRPDGSFGTAERSEPWTVLGLLPWRSPRDPVSANADNRAVSGVAPMEPALSRTDAVGLGPARLSSLRTPRLPGSDPTAVLWLEIRVAFPDQVSRGVSALWARISQCPSCGSFPFAGRFIRNG